MSAKPKPVKDFNPNGQHNMMMPKKKMGGTARPSRGMSMPIKTKPGC